MKNSTGPLLVVEDIPDTLQLLDVTLTFKGYRVVTARNGSEALEAIQKERPALIITDILMPEMDGFSLVHRLRINPDTRGIPVIFLSATYVTPEDKEFAAAIGVTRFLEKPIVIEELLKTVAELISRGMIADSKPLDARKFYEGYRTRLETKLKQKVAQIARTESMLQTLSEAEKPSFRTSLQSSIEERDEIQLLLDQLRDLLAGDK
ncbi:MAG: response regulator [Anaerolineaceae bacterium]|nr:MAG: response regulator [Anaerolineaceae bacterium]